MNAFIKLIALIVVSALGAIAAAFAVSTMWAWFVVPLGAVPITPLTAYGISCIAAVFVAPYVNISKISKNSGESEDTQVFSVMISNIISYGFIVLFAYIALSVFG